MGEQLIQPIGVKASRGALLVRLAVHRRPPSVARPSSLGQLILFRRRRLLSTAKLLSQATDSFCTQVFCVCALVLGNGTHAQDRWPVCGVSLLGVP
jgi:hypothetical protein